MPPWREDTSTGRDAPWHVCTVGAFPDAASPIWCLFAIIRFTGLNFGNEISATRCIKAIGQNNFFTSGQMYGCTIVNNEIIIM